MVLVLIADDELWAVALLVPYHGLLGEVRLLHVGLQQPLYGRPPVEHGGEDRLLLALVRVEVREVVVVEALGLDQVLQLLLREGVVRQVVSIRLLALCHHVRHKLALLPGFFYTLDLQGDLSK